jgi:hypothetical protein
LRKILKALNRQLALTISVIFHPMTIPTWLTLFGLIFTPDIFPYKLTTQINLLLLMFLGTFLLPSIPMLLVFRKDFPDSITSPSYHNRLKAIILEFLVVFGVLFWFAYIGLKGSVVMEILIVTAFNVFFSGIFSVYWKPSLHMSGMWGFISFVMYYQFFIEETDLMLPIIALIILSGMVASSRLALDAHDYPELFAGAVIGAASVVSTFLYLWFL